MKTGRPIRVLIVDATPRLRDHIRVLIEESPGAEIVGEAGTSVEALASFRGTTPDVVVLDVDLPGGGGHAVLNVIKQTRPETVVIVLTMLRIAICRERCLALGADYYFDKSTEFERIPGVLSLLRRAATADSQTGAW